LPGADSLPKRTEAFRAGLRDLGYQEGRDVVIEYRWANSRYDQLPALLAELISLKVDVIVTHGTPGVMAAKQARCGCVGFGGEPGTTGWKRNRIDVFPTRTEREAARAAEGNGARSDERRGAAESSRSDE
jgi:hypothetical protein